MARAPCTKILYYQAKFCHSRDAFSRRCSEFSFDLFSPLLFFFFNLFSFSGLKRRGGNSSLRGDGLRYDSDTIYCIHPVFAPTNACLSFLGPTPFESASPPEVVLEGEKNSYTRYSMCLCLPRSPPFSPHPPFSSHSAQARNGAGAGSCAACRGTALVALQFL